jgi:dCTP diphosphatase
MSGVRKPVGPRLPTVDGGDGRARADTRLVSDIADLTRRMRNFTEARDWARFHDPKSLALALVGEVGELAELLQWVRHEDQATVVRQQPLHDRLAEEMSDVLLYLLRLADVVGVELAEAASAKLRANEKRFPPNDHRSVAPRKA